MGWKLDINRAGAQNFSRTIRSNSTTLKYTLVSDFPLTIKLVNSISNIPTVGDRCPEAYAGGTDQYCTSVRHHNEDGDKVWRITARFDDSEGEIKDGFAYDVVERSSKKQVTAQGAYAKGTLIGAGGTGSSAIETGTIQDAPSIPVQNAVGDAFSPPPMRTVYDSILEFWFLVPKALERAVLNGDWNSWKGTTNRNPVRIAGRNINVAQGVIMDVTWKPFWYRAPDQETGEKRLQAMIQVYIKQDAFGTVLLNQGRNALIETVVPDPTPEGGWGETTPTVSTKFVKSWIKMSDLPEIPNVFAPPPKNSEKDSTVKEDVLLDAEGKILQDQTKPVYYGFLLDKPINWSTLNIPSERGDI